MNDFKSFIWSLAKSHRSDIAISTLSGLIRVGAGLAFIAVCKNLIDMATGNADGSVFLFAILMLGCIAVQLFFGLVSIFVENRSEIIMRNSMRSNIFLHIIKGDWIAASEYHSGDIVTRLNNDVTTVSNMICRDIPYTLITIVQLIGAIIFLLILDLRLAVLIVVIMPLAILTSRMYIKKMKPLNAQLRSVESKIGVAVQEGWRNRTLIKALSGYNYTTGKHENLSDSLYNIIMKKTRMSVSSKIIVQAGFSCGYAVAFLFGIYGLKNHSITFGVMIAFLQLVSQVQRPTLELSKMVPSIAGTMTATERICEILDIPEEKIDNQQVLGGKVGVEFKNVFYKYPGKDSFVLNNFSCCFPAKSLTAVVGASGIGKTTLFRLLLGLITPTEGEITISNEEVQYSVSEATRVNFSYVPQGNSLMNGTIRDNLLLGNPSTDEIEIRKVLNVACADFVYKLPGGLDFKCDEDGTRLSEGQAQRIALARGIIHPSSILLLDEPTSALDFSTAVKLLDNLSKLDKKKTIIIITHSTEISKLCQYKVNLLRK